MIGSLFSGIGGLELGLEMLGLGPVRWQAESDPFARAVLAKHWPDARRYEDVREIDDEAPPVDLICGGFPCQDISNAGKRAGISGERSGLWSEYARIVRVVRPRYVFVENVAALAARGLDRVLGDLAALGFDAEWGVFRAADVGAPHLRERLFILAHARRVGFDGAQPLAIKGREDSSVVGRYGEELADADGRRCESERVGCLLDGERKARGSDVDGRGGEDVADANSVAGRERGAFCGGFGEADSGRRWSELGGRGSLGDADGERRTQGRPGAAVRQRGRHAHLSGHRFPPGPQEIAFWDGPKPSICRSTSRVPGGLDGIERLRARQRIHRLRCLGNAVVPQVAALAFRSLAARALAEVAA